MAKASPGRPVAMPSAYAGVVVLTGRLVPDERSRSWTWACVAAAR